MNKIVDKKEVKGNKNEMCSRHKLKSRTSERLMSENPVEKYFDILGKCAYLYSGWEFDQRIYTTLIFVC